MLGSVRDIVLFGSRCVEEKFPCILKAHHLLFIIELKMGNTGENNK
jgi:hypothetical protein